MKALTLWIVSNFFLVTFLFSTHPFLSAGSSWSSFCDWTLSEGQGFDPTKVQKGDTILIEDIDQTSMEILRYFENEYLPFISAPFILITPRADLQLPGPFSHLLLSEKIWAWYVQNIDRPPCDKLRAIPIGIPPESVGYRPELLEELQRPTNFKDPTTYTRNYFIYVNWSPTHPDRKKTLEHFRSIPSASFSERKPLYDYLSDLYHSVFVISPEGAGPDCHRTWEALILGAYPVVKHSTLDPLFENLPVVLVDDWNEVTEDLLQKKKEEFDAMSWEYEKLYSTYWFEQVNQLRDQKLSTSN